MAKKMIFGWYDCMKAGLLSLLACCLLGSCDGLMHDDLPPCETGAYLHFVYDYNIQRADMFNDHVGGLVVFVYDENGKFVTRQEAANSSLASTALLPSPGRKLTARRWLHAVPSSG